MADRHDHGEGQQEVRDRIGRGYASHDSFHSTVWNAYRLRMTLR